MARDRSALGGGGQDNKLVLYVALVANVGIAIAKFIAAGITGSSAMLTEGIHSVVDSSNEVLLLYGQHRAGKPADRQHPLGYGRELYFWSFVVALLIFAAGAGISIYEGILHILAPEPLTDPTINYVVLGIAFVLEGISWAIALKKFVEMKGDCGWYEAIRRSKNPPSFIVFLEDSAAMIGILIAAAGVFLTHRLGDPVYDGAASILIGCVLGAVAAVLARESKHLLIGESADPALNAAVRELAEARAEVSAVTEVVTIQMAPDSVFLAMSVDLDETLGGVAMEALIASLEAEIIADWPIVTRAYIKPVTTLAPAGR